MKLILKREQKEGGAFSAPKFVLMAKAELTEAEAACTRKYKMGEIILYEKETDAPNPNSFMSLAKYRFTVPRIDVNDLMTGKTIEVKTIADALDVEGQLMQAGKVFQNLISAAINFQGETVHDFASA